MQKVMLVSLFAAALLFVLGCAPDSASSAQAKAAASKEKPAPVKQIPASKAQPTAPAPAKAADKAAKAQLKDDMKVLKAWDFTQLKPEQWTDIRFPGNSKVKFPGGAAFTVWKSGIGPDMPKLDLKAEDVSAIRIELSARRTKDKEGQHKTVVNIPGVKVLWASPADVGPGKDMYAKARVASFKPDNPENPAVWTATLKGLSNWKGSIARFAFAFDLPEDLKEGGRDRYHIVVKKIEFLK